jgi:hypothetical protein
MKSSWMESTIGCITWRHRSFDKGLQKLVSRCDKCLHVDGKYVEKYCSYVCNCSL